MSFSSLDLTLTLSLDSSNLKKVIITFPQEFKYEEHLKSLFINHPEIISSIECTDLKNNSLKKYIIEFNEIDSNDEIEYIKKDFNTDLDSIKNILSHCDNLALLILELNSLIKLQKKISILNSYNYFVGKCVTLQEINVNGEFKDLQLAPLLQSIKLAQETLS